mgnify:CR=1 FL=1
MRKKYADCGKLCQMKIQQMAFMILAVFLFFIFVGLFFLGWQFQDIEEGYAELQKKQAITFLERLANMPEFNCDSMSSVSGMCVDADKLDVMSSKAMTSYNKILPVESVKVYKIYPRFSEKIRCPGVNCNYWNIYDKNNQSINEKEFSTYVSICKKISGGGYVYDNCEIGKIVTGVDLSKLEE